MAVIYVYANGADKPPTGLVHYLEDDERTFEHCKQDEPPIRKFKFTNRGLQARIVAHLARMHEDDAKSISNALKAKMKNVSRTLSDLRVLGKVAKVGHKNYPHPTSSTGVVSVGRWRYITGRPE
jgi:hypothetical protein